MHRAMHPRSENLPRAKRRASLAVLFGLKVEAHEGQNAAQQGVGVDERGLGPACLGTLATQPRVGQTGEANQECRPRRLKKSGSRRRREALHGPAFNSASGLGRRLAPCEAPYWTDKSAVLCEVLGWSSSEPKAMGLRPAVSKSVAVFSPPSGLDLGFRIWVLPNNGLQQTRSTRFFPWGIRAASLRPVALAAEPGVEQTALAEQHGILV